jgi:hypothetical protein
MGLALLRGMELLRSTSVRKVVDTAGRMVFRSAGTILGFSMIVIGLAMTATIVMLPAGMVLGLLGVAIVVVSLLTTREREGHDATSGDHTVS